MICTARCAVMIYQACGLDKQKENFWQTKVLFLLVGDGGFVTTGSLRSPHKNADFHLCAVFRPPRVFCRSFSSHRSPTNTKGIAIRLCLLCWWEMVDSDHRSEDATDLQSAPFGHSGNLPYKRESIVWTLGAGERSRTINLLITNQLLCH